MIVTVKDLSSDHKLLFVHEINCLLFRTNISLCFALVCQMIKNSTKFVVVYISLKQILRRSEYCWSYFDNCFHWKAWRTINCHSCGTKEMSFHFEMQLISGWGFIKNIRNGKVKVKLLSRVWLFATPWTIAYQASPYMGFSRQEYWSGLPFPSPGDLPDPGIEPRSPILQADALPSEPPGKP